MPNLHVLIQTGKVCQCLRDKKLYYEQAEPADVATLESLKSSSMPQGPFWCALTQSLLGPDGNVADTESCRPGRSCCATA